MLIDTHCHLDFPEYDPDRDEVISRAQREGVGCIINIGSSLQGSRRSLELAGNYESIYATVGMHPHEADKFEAKDAALLKGLAGDEKVVAIGEVGLDYYKGYSRPENQKPLFLSLVKLAKELNLPLVIHSRQAPQETLDILRPFLPHKVVVHCFSQDEAFLKECLDLGFFVSFTCNITYKKAQNLRDLVRITPLERLFLETDAPFLPPENLRGRRNEPLHVKELAEEIARIKEIGLEEIARITTQNAQQFFNLR
ncbi:MAG: TatD family deoxyribonuclease [Candidatus Omnitrophica bacterium]|nr:TatD family deoxyribonuclease [Candidatus Omnitrophota bacterium]